MIYPAYFAAWHKDKDVLRKSTSGGAFSALAQPFINNGGIVVGAAYDENLNVRHIVVDSEEGLNRLRGVKYVHGEMRREVFDDIAIALDAKRSVLFTGLPCQAAAVRQRFGKAKGLVVVELVCFEAPPLRLWQKYVGWLEKRRGVKLIYVDPRDKAKGWGVKTYYRYEWADGKISRKSSLYDPYAQAFYRSIAAGRGCFRCPFKGIGSRADITIGDCNGYKAMHFTRERVKDGISCVIVRTPVGEDAIKFAQLTMQSISEELAVRGNRPIVDVAKKPDDWDSFNVDLQAMSFEELIEKYHLQNSRFRHLIGKLKGKIASMLSIVRRSRIGVKEGTLT